MSNVSPREADAVVRPQSATTDADARWRIFDEINQERVRQDQKHGVHDHPMTPDVALARANGMRWRPVGHVTCVLLGIVNERDAKTLAQDAFREGRGTFGHIVVEETAEFFGACALHGDLSDKAREEAVQNAAVWVAIVESIDRRRAA